MDGTIPCQVGALLVALCESGDDVVASCPCAVLGRGVMETLHSSLDGSTLTDALAERSLYLVREEEKANATLQMLSVTHDKLQAELARVEAQMRRQERLLRDLDQQKTLCKLALNTVLADGLPQFVEANSSETTTQAAAALLDRRTGTGSAADKEDDDALSPTQIAPAPMRNATATNTESDKTVSLPVEERAGMLYSEQLYSVNKQHHGDESDKGESAVDAGSEGKRTSRCVDGGSTRHSNEVVEKGSETALESSSDAAVVEVSHQSSSLLSMLRVSDVKESTLLRTLALYDQHVFANSGSWIANEAVRRDVTAVFLALLRHLPAPRPPVQLTELHMLEHILHAIPSGNAREDANLCLVLHTVVDKGSAVRVLTRLLSSVNDEIKCEALECLSPLVCLSHALTVAMPPELNVCGLARREFLRCGGLEPLVNIVVCSTSEAVLERALVFLWGLLSKDEQNDTECNGGRSIRAQVRELGGLRAVLDLLYTDSLVILENVCMVIGYITREDESKDEIREIGGLEKITATLRHPSDSIRAKMAGSVWNCASNALNRAHLRNIGAIPALLELLRMPGPVAGPDAAALVTTGAGAPRDGATSEFVRENAAGALWNVSVDAENKSQILEYGGVPLLLNVMLTSRSVPVIENVTGTLWNCSALVEARPAIRKAGGVTVLLDFLRARGVAPTGSSSPPPSSTASKSAATLPAILQQGISVSDKILDNVAGTLRNCAINDQVKPLIRDAGGVELLLRCIQRSLLLGVTTMASAATTESLTSEQVSVLPSSTIDRLASTLWILTISPDIKNAVRLADGIKSITDVLAAASPTLCAQPTSATSSPFLLRGQGQPSSLQSKLPSLSWYESLYAPTVLQSIPFVPPKVLVNIGVKEKLVGVLRNCSTIPENRQIMLEHSVVRCLVAVILDCYSSHSVFQGGGTRKNSRFCEPSTQLKETVASAMWYLSRDDKTVTREQGGLELMCMFVATPQQPFVVLEQAAGALSSMTVNNNDNRNAIRVAGGLQALIHLVSARSVTDHVIVGTREGGAAKGDLSSQTYAILNALLTIRNSLSGNEENLKLCCSAALDGDAAFLRALLTLVEFASEECIREAVITLKYVCNSEKVLDYVVSHNGAALMRMLIERTSSDSVRRAASATLQLMSRTGSVAMHV